MKKRVIRLDNIRQINRFLTRLVNDVYNDDIPENKAKTITTICNSKIKIFEVTKLAEQLEKQNHIETEPLTEQEIDKIHSLFDKME